MMEIGWHNIRKFDTVTTTANILFDSQIKYNTQRAMAARMSFDGPRHYDPEIGRWIERDPILFRGGQANLYAYVNNEVNLSNSAQNRAVFSLGTRHLPRVHRGRDC